MSFTHVLNPDAIDRTAPLPLYHQLREALLEALQSGYWQEGDPIPTEREMCRNYDVSRITVRRAIEDLVRDGFLVTRQGKGTFVARPKIQRHLSQLKGFSDEMIEEGHRPGSRLLSLRHEPAAGKVADALGVEHGAWIWIVERLRLADEEPMGISRAHLHLPSGTYLTPDELRQQQSLWGLLREKGITFASSEVTIQAVLATEQEAELLGVAPGVPLLLVEGVVCAPDGSPIEYYKMVNRGDRYKYNCRTPR